MYTTLVAITCFIIVLLAIGVFTPIDAIDEPTKKEILIEILISLSFLASTILLLFVFAKTTTMILSKTPDVKESKQPWRTIYKNDINADVKIEPAGPYKNTITPKDTISEEDIKRYMPDYSFPWTNKNEASVDITAKNDVDETTKRVILPKNNIIETWPKEMKPNKSKGHITKIEYRSTPVTRKWFGISIDKVNYEEIRITIDYEGQKDPSTAQLFGED
jgi:hypothetical protein